MHDQSDATDYRDDRQLGEFFSQIVAGEASFHDRRFHRVVYAAMDKLRGIAHREEITAPEALSYAAEAWLEDPKAFADATSPWSLTLASVQRRAALHSQADRLGISVAAIKRAQKNNTPVDTTIRRVPIDDELAERLEAPPCILAPVEMGSAGLITVDLLEELAGWTREDAVRAVETALDALVAYTETAHQKADDTIAVGQRLERLLTRLKRDDDLAERLSITRAQLVALGSLLLTSWSGAPGVLWLTTLGQPVDPTAKNIRMAVKKLAR